MRIEVSEKGALPPGWRWVRVGDVIRDAQSGFASGERDAGGVVQLRMNNVTSSGRFDWSALTRVPADAAVIETFGLEPDDVLFNNTNSVELVGKSALFGGFEEPVVFSNHFTRIRTDDTELVPEFLAAWLQQRWNSGLFARICHRWVGQAAVQRERLLDLQMALPDVPQQKRIAAALREQTAVVERARAAAEAQLEAASALPVAYILSAFEESKTRAWPTGPLADVCTLLPSRSIASDGDTVVQTITTACLSETGFRPEGVKTARMWAESATDCVVRRGEVLVARSNTPELVGRACLFDGSPPSVVASDLTIRVEAGTKMYAPFLAAFLSFLYVTGYWRAKSGGASGSMKKITRSQLENQAIPVPELDDQRRVSEELSGALSTAERIQRTVDAQLQTIAAMKGALLRRAFSGDL